jgi:phosphoribosyl-AMP cyclohydrolase
MLAYMNREAYAETLRTGRVCYWSRSRGKLWRKGEESGNVQELKSVWYDCDADTLLVKVHQIGGAACHEGYRSCFFRRIDPQTGAVTTVGERLFDPQAVYGKK